LAGRHHPLQILLLFLFLCPPLQAGFAAVPDDGTSADGWTAGWEERVTWQSDGGRLKVRFGGRLHVDANGLSADRTVRDAVNHGEALDNDVDFRRARLCLSGSYGRRLIFKADYEFVTIIEDFRNFRDLYLGLRDLPVVGTVFFGNVKEPLGLEQQASTNHIPFTERSLAFFLLPLRNRGVANQAGMLEGRMTWAAGFYRDVDGYNRGNGSGITGSGRLTALPWRPAGDRLLHLGLACSVRDLDELRLAAVPESNKTPVYLDTGTFDASGALSTNLESALLLGPLSLQGEYVRSSVRSSEAGDPVFHGGYVQVSWFITGGRRACSPALGKFVRPVLDGDVSRGGGPGAWELAARWSALDLDDGAMPEGRLTDVTLGVNWYLNRHCRLMLDGIRAHLSGIGDTLIATFRFQVDY